MKTDKDTYKIRSVKDDKEHRSFVHHNRLKHYNSPEDQQLPQQVLDVPIPQPVTAAPLNETSEHGQTTDDISVQEMQEAVKVIKIHQKNKKLYLVLWADNLRTWEHIENIPPKLIQEYHIHRSIKGKKRKKYQKQNHRNHYSLISKIKFSVAH